MNVYSKSEHELGRLLSNFAHTPFTAPSGMRFESVEGWWYWFTTGKLHPHLAKLHGFAAKQEGKKYPRVMEVKPEVLEQVYRLKLDQNPRIKEMLLAYDGEFEHYYVFGGKKVVPHGGEWTAKLWEKIRDDLRS